MNRSEMISVLKEEADLSRKDAETVTDLFFEMIVKTLARGERVEIRGFGSFTVNHYKPYTGRNPKNGSFLEGTRIWAPVFGLRPV